jgi:zinc-binding in reverse transcriptase
MYNFLCFGGIKTNLSTSVWALKIPLKYKLFLWMTLHNKIFTKDNLIKRGWSGDNSCVFCSLSNQLITYFLIALLYLIFGIEILLATLRGDY